MRSTQDIRADISAVDDEIEATRGLMDSRVPLPCYATWDKEDRGAYQAIIDSLKRKRARLEAELADERAVEAMTPNMFEEVRA
jgi:hypothetical protein